MTDSLYKGTGGHNYIQDEDMETSFIKQQQEEAELAVFWDEIAQNLPKSIERNALGDEKIFRAFATTYPKIKAQIIKNTFTEALRIIDTMTPNKQPECVECTEHEMIREGSIHQIKAMNCRVKPLDPVFFDTTATEQPEWGKVAEKWLEKESVRVSVLTDLQTLIKEIISSRDTYWKERIRKEVEKLNLRVNQITDGTGVTPVQRGGTSHGHYQAHGEVMGLKTGIRALDTLLDNLK